MKEKGFGPKKKGFDPTRMTPPMADISWVKRKYLDVPYGESKAQCLDIFLPDEGDGPFPVIVHIHGGGFAFGDKRDDHMDAYLDGIKRGFAVASIEYRMSGEACFPAAVLDVREAIRFLRENAGEYHIDPESIGVLGGSAGGNLAAMLAMNVKNGEFPGEAIGTIRKTEPKVKAAVCQFGPMNFSTMEQQARENGISATHEDMADMPESKYIGVPIDKADPEILKQSNPATYASASMCPVLVQHGTKDHLVPYAQSEEFVQAVIKAAGEKKVTFKPLEGADHEDKMFVNGPNMGFVWNYFKEQLET